ncbi:hypothetical protein MKX01_007021 [Papaver californicum]|nr:hypothetical protein MKX01_007021 [Papaver californicum]
MHWLGDPELYLGCTSRGDICYWRLQKTYGSPLVSSDFAHETPVEDHLALVNFSFDWKKSDYEAFVAFICRHDLLVNCQGLACPITYPRENNTPNMYKGVYFWSHEIVDLTRYGLPVPSVPFREVRYMGGRSAPVEPSPKENELAAQLAPCIEERDQEKAKNETLEKRISRLEDTNSNLRSRNYLFDQKNI